MSIKAPWLGDRRHWLLLALVLAVALLHALAQARLRPLYQVSDEMAYLRAAQVLALDGAAPALRPCIAPPDGTLFELGEGGKAGFRRTTAWQLRWLCERDPSALPLFALRAVQAVSLPLIALAAWLLAWQVSGSRAAALAAALIVAVHPVAAKYAGGVTPDAWANAFSAWAFVAATRMVIGRHRWWDAVALAGCTLGGLLWKDTTHLLVAVAAASYVCALVWWWRRRQAGRASPARHRLPAAAGGVLLVAAATWWAWRDASWAALVTPYLAEAAGRVPEVTAQPWTFLRAVLDDLLVQAPGFAASSVLSLYRPLVYTAAQPWHQPLTPVGVAVALLALAGFGGVGGLRALTRPHGTVARLPAAAVVLWALALVACAAQPSVRLVLLDVTGVHQGRWLLPLLAPAAAFIGVGLAVVVRGAAAVPPAVVVGLGCIWVVVIDLVRHYYLHLPDVLRTTALFTRPTGDIDVGDRAITAVITGTVAAQSAPLTWGILVVLATTTLWLAWVVAHHDQPPAPHV